MDLGTSNIRFCDSYRLTMQSLDNTCRAFGVEIDKNERFDILFGGELKNILMTPGKKLPEDLTSDTRLAMIDYCEQDSQALRQVMVKFEQTLLDQGMSLKLGNTISMLTYHGFLVTEGNNLLEQGNEIHKLSTSEQEMVRNTYSGGITDVFKRIMINKNFF